MAVYKILTFMGWMKRQGLRVTILLFCLLLFGAAFSQKSSTGNWFIYFGNQSINKKWNWHNEVQYRNYNMAGDLEQLMLRTGIGHNLTDNNNLLLGYAFILSGRYDSAGHKNYTNEHRIFQQFITRQNFGRIFLQHRYRLEERFLPGDFKMRFRYFLAANIPLNKKEMSAKAVYASLYNEIFIHTESPLFDRNRIYGALGYVINKSLKAEIGFMSQLHEKSHRNQLQVVFFNNLPF